MDLTLRENKSHGTKEYPYSQHCIQNVPYGFHFPVHWHEEMEWIYVRNGHLLVNVDGTDYSLTSGQVLIINPRQLHLMHTEDPLVHYDTLLFPVELISFQSPDQLDQSVFYPLRTGRKVLPNLVPEQILTQENLQKLEQVVRINNRKPPMYQLESRLLLLSFLLEVLRGVRMVDTAEDPAGQLQRQMLAYLQMHYKQSITLSELSDRFHLSEKYISRYFKEHFHLTISEYILHMRMTQAKKLLSNTDLSITEVAAQCGFSGVSFFIRQFTKETGSSPGKWRQAQVQRNTDFSAI